MSPRQGRDRKQGFQHWHNIFVLIRGIRENSRGPDPTMFEYLRKDLGLAQSDVWITTSGGATRTANG